MNHKISDTHKFGAIWYIIIIIITFHIKLLLNIMVNAHIKTHHSMVCNSYI